MATAADEAIDLAALTAGLRLDEWQQLVLREALGERPGGQWAALQVALLTPRQNGKNAVLLALELACLFLFRQRLVIHSAHEFKTAAESFRQMKDLIDGSDELRKHVHQIRTSAGMEGVQLRSGQRLRFFTRSGSLGRGFAGETVVFDEAYSLDREEIAALLPVLSAQPNPQVWYTSSAGTARSTQLKYIRDRGRAGEGQDLAYLEWGADPGASLDDRDAWAQANPGLGIRISERFVALERQSMGDAEFARERLGVWQETAYEPVITSEAWEGLTDEGSAPVDPVAFAVDMTPERDSVSIAVAGSRHDGMRHVELVQVDRGTRWVVGRVQDLVERWSPCAVVVHPGSPAGALIADLEAAEVKVTKPRTQDAAQACGQFYDAVTEERLAHRGQAELNAAVSGAVSRPTGDAWLWDRRAPTVDVSPLIAVTLALWGFVTYGEDAGEMDLFQAWVV